MDGTMKVYCKANLGYNLTIRNGKVVLAPSDPKDEFQHWYKDEKFSSSVKDDEGFPGFSLVNKATGEAIKHPTGARNFVQLVPYKPDVLDKSVLWTASNDVRDGYKAIRMVTNTHLNLDAFIGNGSIINGTNVGVWEWNCGDNQIWMIAPNTGLGKVVLAPSDPDDEFQVWYKDEKFSSSVKDEAGFPGFSLINKATGEAIKHAIGARFPVRLVPYKPDVLDESILWSASNEARDGYKAIRNVTNTSLNLDAFIGSGSIINGTTVGLWKWNNGDNQIWKIVPNTVNIYCKENPGYNLTIRNGKVVLAPSDPNDEFQHWYKDEKFSSSVKDDEGFPGFSLINKVTGEAIKHASVERDLVQLVPYKPDVLDKSILWTASNDVRDGYNAIRMVTNTHLNLDAFIGDGSIINGTGIGVWEWHSGDNQIWMIVPSSVRVYCKANPNYNLTIRPCKVVLQKPMKVYCKDNHSYNLTIRQGKVVLAPSDPNDEFQEWYKDEKFSSSVKDDEGFPGFSLINKATGEAIKHPTGAHALVQLVPYKPYVLDKSVIWTASNEVRDGYKAIRMVTNSHLNFDAFIGDGSIINGTNIGVWEWNNGDNQIWKIVPN
ncbi:ricin B-like lectin R40G2 [Hibiscus syriacus]|nr:ricin B-like lectin R40G2 [Hibiscus syriacus]